MGSEKFTKEHYARKRDEHAKKAEATAHATLAIYFDRRANA